MFSGQNSIYLKEMALITIENDILIATQKLNIIIGVPDETVVIPEDTDTIHEKILLMTSIWSRHSGIHLTIISPDSRQNLASFA